MGKSRLLYCWLLGGLWVLALLGGQGCETRQPLSLLPTHPETILWQKLEGRVRNYARSWPGVVGVSIYDIKGQKQFNFHGDVLFPAASTIKLAVLVEALHRVEAGDYSLGQSFRIGRKYYVTGGGRLQNKLKRSEEIERTLEQLLSAMIIQSDNVATNFLIDLLGMGHLNKSIRQAGLRFTRLRRPMMDVASVVKGNDNVTTPRDMALLLRRLYNGKLLSPRYTTKALAILKGVDKYMRRGVAAQIEIASKPGYVPGAICEAGIIYLPGRPFVVAIMTTYNGKELNANPVVAITRIVYDFLQRMAHANRYGHTPKGYN